MALLEPPHLRVTRTLLLTCCTAIWCVDQLPGAGYGGQFVITYAWVSMATLRLREVPEPPISMRALVVGQLLWCALPLVRKTAPHWWVWIPATVPAAGVAAGAVLIVGWALQPFLVRAVRLLVDVPRSPGGRWTRAGDYDAIALGLGGFLVSGSTVFAVAACLAAMLILWRARVQPALAAVRVVPLHRPALRNAADAAPVL